MLRRKYPDPAFAPVNSQSMNAAVTGCVSYFRNLAMSGGLFRRPRRVSSPERIKGWQDTSLFLFVGARQQRSIAERLRQCFAQVGNRTRAVTAALKRLDCRALRRVPGA